jgi:hypothetical protein
MSWAWRAIVSTDEDKPTSRRPPFMSDRACGRRFCRSRTARWLMCESPELRPRSLRGCCAGGSSTGARIPSPARIARSRVSAVPETGARSEAFTRRPPPMPAISSRQPAWPGRGQSHSDRARRRRSWAERTSSGQPARVARRCSGSGGCAIQQQVPHGAYGAARSFVRKTGVGAPWTRRGAVMSSGDAGFAPARLRGWCGSARRRPGEERPRD